MCYSQVLHFQECVTYMLWVKISQFNRAVKYIYIVMIILGYITLNGGGVCGRPAAVFARHPHPLSRDLKPTKKMSTQCTATYILHSIIKITGVHSMEFRHPPKQKSHRNPHFFKPKLPGQKVWLTDLSTDICCASPCLLEPLEGGGQKH